MKKIVLTSLVFILVLLGSALADQPAEEKKGSSMQGMMQEMMKQKQGGEGNMEGMGGMMGMMRMMKQCSAMMESHDQSNGDAKETRK